MNILAVTGGRAFTDRGFIFSALWEAHQLIDFGILVHGDAPGVDKICREWVELCGHGRILHEPFPAIWDDLGGVPSRHIRKRPDGSRYNVLAGFQRNEQMARRPGLTHGLVFPGGTGTADMAERLIARLGKDAVRDLRGSFMQ